MILSTVQLCTIWSTQSPQGRGVDYLTPVWTVTCVSCPTAIWEYGHLQDRVCPAPRRLPGPLTRHLLSVEEHLSNLPVRFPWDFFFGGGTSFFNVYYLFIWLRWVLIVALRI